MKDDVVLITGAGGFLGSHLSRRMEGKNIFLTSLRSNQDKNIHVLDLTDYEQVKEMILKLRPTVVYHLGAVVNLSRDYETARETLDTNIQSTLNILEALRRFPPRKFIFASTEEIYGESEVPYKEMMIPKPPSPYAVSKVACEQLCHMYAKELNFSSVIFRIGTMYGPEQLTERFIPSIISRAIKGEDIRLNSGMKMRDYIFIDDVIDAFLLTRDCSLKEKDIILNLGGGISIRLIDLVHDIVQRVHSTSKIVLGVIPDRLSESDIWLMDNTKVTTILGWRPRITIEEGIQRTCEYYNGV